MTETKSFPTADVLGVVTGRLLREGGFNDLHEVVEWMAGEPVFTHQIPRICDEASPVIVAMHPELQAVVREAEVMDGGNCLAIVAGWRQRYGETITVPRMNADQHERIDPVSELAEKVHPDNIIIARRP